MTALLINIGVALLGLISGVSIAGFVVLVMIHAKVATYHGLNGEGSTL